MIEDQLSNKKLKSKWGSFGKYKQLFLIFIVFFSLGSLFFYFNYSRNKSLYSFQTFIQSFIPEKLKENIVYPGQNSLDPKMSQSETLIQLPEPYLKAGSFHPELYPHDASYSISAILRLVDKKVLNESYLDLVKSILNNFYFMVEHYGYVLNGNRTYYTTRSQANTIPTNVLEYFQASQDLNWLKKIGISLAERTLNYWTQKKSTAEIVPYKLYKWIAHGKGPCEEVLASNKEHNFYYDNVLSILVNYAYQDELSRPSFARGFDYSKLIKNCDLEDVKTRDQCELDDYYYLNDRASRVSGYDTNHLYGPFNSFSTEFLPVDHNVKLYRSANDLSELFRFLGNNEKSAYYENFAQDIKTSIFKFLWDEDQGMFFDYHLNGTGLRTNYAFTGAAYTIWAKIFDITSDKELIMLSRLVKFLEHELEGPDGLYASNIVTGLHWDKPYTWPIHQGMVVEGLIYYSKLLKDSNPEKSEYLMSFAKRISKKYIEANYQDWKNSKGENIKEKLIGQEQENLITGYAVAENYSWNLLAVLDFCSLNY